MAAPLANLMALRARWNDLPREQEVEAEQALIDASLEVRGRFPTIDRRMATGELDRDLVAMVICRMVKRAMEPVESTQEAPHNATQLSFGAGGFSHQVTLRPNDGAIYLSKADIRLLAPASTEGQFFNITPQ